MSSTRHAKPGAPLRQERFASSYDRGLLANLVSKRCGVLADPDERAMVWFLQWLSWQPGGLANAPVAGLEDYCLDPGASITGESLDVLRAFRNQYLARAATGRVQTSFGSRIAATLDYTRSARTISIIDGPSRTGKSFATRAWCEQSGGLARYVEVPCSPDDTSFFHRLAKALGVSINLNSKAVELRTRVEDVLQNGDLMLVLDEAHYCWPAGRLRHSTMPFRINWIDTALANFNVPVALVTTPQFYVAQKSVEKQTGWNSDQFIGRVGHVERLPEKLPFADLVDVAAALMPAGGSRSHRKLAAYADISRKHLASIEAIVKRATWLARRDGESGASEEHIDRAINECVIPSDAALSVSLREGGQVAAEASRPIRSGFAAPPRGANEPSAEVPQLDSSRR